MRKFLIAVGVLALLSGLGTVLSAESSLYTKRTCSRDAVVKCGVFNQSELNAGLKSDSRKLYQDLGIPTDLSLAKKGVLYPQTGEIKVDGRVVATNAESYGRDGGKFSKRSSARAFAGIKATPVYVFYNADGSFKVAVAHICGNPITAKPKDKPVYKCDALSVTKINRTSFKFKTDYTAKDVTVLETVYVVKDANGKEVYRGTKDTFTTNTPGEYTVESTLKVKLPNGVTTYAKSANCVKKFVVEKPPVSYSCKALTVQKISRNEFKFSTEFASQNATQKTITYVVTDANGQEVYKGYDNTFTTEKPGNYTVRAHVSFEVDGVIKTATSDNCVKQITIVKPEAKDIQVCDLTTKKVITIKEDQFDATKHSKDLDDCKEVVVKDIEVCELATKEVITIKETEFDETKHSTNLEDCVEEEVETIEVCDLTTKEIVTINKDEYDETKHSMDAADCEEVPVTPEEPETPVTPEAPVVTELPKTGNAGLISSGLGLGSLIAAISYYGASRRALR